MLELIESHQYDHFMYYIAVRADGVHPAEFEPYQDMASNIGHELSKYYDIAYNQE